MSGDSSSQEVEYWFKAFLVMAALSAAVFTVQHLVAKIFDPIFEVCIFYIPTLITLAVYLHLRIRTRKP